MNDGEDLDVDSLVRSLNQIAEKENDKIIAHVDKLYDKTVTLASPRLMKESNLDFTHQGALQEHQMDLHRLCLNLVHTPISSSISTEEMTLADAPYASMTWLHKLRKWRGQNVIKYSMKLYYCIANDSSISNLNIKSKSKS